jgi:site-specific recombinase XerD
MDRKKNPARVATVQQRTDHQPREHPPLASARMHKRMAHNTRIDKYRDKLFSILAKASISPTLFDKLDGNSMEGIRGLSHNSQIALYSDFCGYIEHVVSAGLEPFPVKEHALRFYLDCLASEGYKYTTVQRHMNSLRTWHKWAELDDPTASLAIESRLKQFKNSKAGFVSQKEALKLADLQKAVEVHRTDVPRDVADLSLLFTAFETLCRRSELVSFNWADLRIDTDGSGTLFLASSKTDQEHAGEFLYVSPVTVQLLLYWQSVSGTASGKIFRSIYSNGQIGQALSTKGVANAFKRIAVKIGIDPDLIAGHSTRIGAAVDMLEAGISLPKMMRSGRWASPAMINRYTRQAQAKQSGMAELTANANWTPVNILGAGSRALPTGKTDSEDD